MNTTTNPPKPRHRVRRIVLSALAVFVLVLAGGGAWAVHSYGPVYGIWWPKPSPESYGEQMLAIMDSGLHAKDAEWDEARAQALAEIRSAQTHEDVDVILDTALKVAGGKHSFILTKEDYEEVAADYVAPTSSMDGCILTVTVPGYMGTPDQGQKFADALEGAIHTDGVCGVIVDLRDNDGGDMGPMIAGLSPLLPDGTVTGFDMGSYTSDSSLEKGAFSGGGTPTTVSNATKVHVPVAVLTSNVTASSGEQTLLAFRGLDNAKVFGRPTAGYASVNMQIPMYTGKTMALTVGVTLARTGERFGEDPIAPDVVTDVDQADESAAEWIAGRVG